MKYKTRESKAPNNIYTYTRNSIIGSESVKSTTLPILHLSFSPVQGETQPLLPPGEDARIHNSRKTLLSSLPRHWNERKHRVPAALGRFSKGERQIRSLNTYRGQASTFQPKTQPAAAGDNCTEQRGGSLAPSSTGLFRVEQPCRPSKGEAFAPPRWRGGGLRTRQPSGSDLDQPLCEISSGPRLSATVYNLHPPLPSSLTRLSPFSKRVHIHIYVCVCARVCVGYSVNHHSRHCWQLGAVSRTYEPPSSSSSSLPPPPCTNA